MPHRSSPTVIFAIDAGDSELVQRWTQAGFMPTTANIISSGMFSTVEDLELLNEMGSWLSALSGVPKLKHGYYHFRKLVPGTYRLTPNKPSSTKGALPFWFYTQEKRIRCAVIDPPEFNVYQGVDGVQLANWETHKSERLQEPLMSIPPDFADDVTAKYGTSEKLAAYSSGAGEDKDLAQLKAGLQRIRRKGALCVDVLSKQQFDLIFIAFHEAHTLGHRLWNYHSEQAATNELTNGIRDVYGAIDSEIGKIISILPADANIFVMSLYGLKGMYPTSGITESFLHELGYQTSAPAATHMASIDPLGTLRKIVPARLRAIVSDRLPSFTQESLISNHFERSSDWTRTKAFSIPSLYNSLIRINLKGREPNGIVTNAEYDSVMDQIEEDLLLLIDPNTQRPAVRRIIRTCDAFSKDRNHCFPDMFVEWQWNGHFVDVLHHPRATIKQGKQRYHRSSFHAPVGFVAARGPSIASHALSQGPIDVIDFAPTFLTLLGATVPPHMQGKVIKQLCAEPELVFCR